MYLVDVAKDDSGRKYIIPAGNPIHDTHTYVRRNISQDEALTLVPQSKLINRAQAKC